MRIKGFGAPLLFVLLFLAISCQSLECSSSTSNNSGSLRSAVFALISDGCKEVDVVIDEPLSDLSPLNLDGMIDFGSQDISMALEWKDSSSPSILKGFKEFSRVSLKGFKFSGSGISFDSVLDIKIGESSFDRIKNIAIDVNNGTNLWLKDSNFTKNEGFLSIDCASTFSGVSFRENTGRSNFGAENVMDRCNFTNNQQLEFNFGFNFSNPIPHCSISNSSFTGNNKISMNYGTNSLLLSNNLFTSNYVDEFLFRVEQGLLEITNSSFNENYFGNSLFLSNQSLIQSSIFHFNQASFGPMLVSMEYLELLDSVFTKNQGDLVHSDKVVVKRSRLEGTNSYRRGSISSNSSTEVVECSFVSNKGLAVLIPVKTMKVEDSIFVNNSAGAIRGSQLLEENNIFVHSSYFEGNNAGWGGAIYSPQSLEVSNCTFKNNYSLMFGGAIDASGTLLVRSSSFEGNHVKMFGGGAIRQQSGQISIEESLFVENQAQQGGAISTSYVESPSIVGSVFRSNIAQGDGGALEFGSLSGTSNLTLLGSSFEFNEARGDGGAISLRLKNPKTSLFSNCTFKDNLSHKKGGGLRVVSSSSKRGETEFQLNSFLFKGNTAANGGGFYVSGSEKIVVVDSSFEKNSEAGFCESRCEFGSSAFGTEQTVIVASGSSVKFFNSTGSSFVCKGGDQCGTITNQTSNQTTDITSTEETKENVPSSTEQQTYSDPNNNIQRGSTSRSSLPLFSLMVVLIFLL